ncbi:hypothetical protein [Nocardia speluncae]|uniref:hypothetical protein n=1 Tax=Nocardia speluncae TaxID=419477 RepID=UPI0008368167|nr:hypothetical protein [Nocardia speluncae]
MTDKPAEPAAGEPAAEARPATGDIPAEDAVASVAADDTASGADRPREGAGTADSVSSAPATLETEVTTGRGGATPEGAEPVRADPAAPGSGARPRVLLGALAVAVLLLIGAVGAAGYLYVQERDKAEVLAAYDEVRQAACRYAPVLADYDAQNLEPYFSSVLAGATGDWKKEFETTTGELREALVAGEVVSAAGDIQCAVKTADPTSAEVVVVIGQTITSLGTHGQPAPGQLAMVMRMQKTDGRWLVDQMTSPLAEPMQ